MISIAQALTNNHSVKILHIAGNCFARNSLLSMATALLQNTTLTALNFANNKIDSSGAAVIASIILQTTTVQIMDLSRNHFGDSGIKNIAEALKINTSVKTLDISYNRASSSAAIALSEMIRHNVTICTMDVSDSKIGDDGVSGLAKALKHNTALTSLRNNFTSLLAASDWILIKKSETRNVQLQTTAPKEIQAQIIVAQTTNVCRVERCLISVVPAGILQLSMLTELNLSHNFLTAFPTTITTLQLLQSLDVSYNHIPAIPAEISALQQLQHLKAKNNVLTQIPLELADLPQLMSLNISRNELERLPFTFVKLLRKRGAKLQYGRNKYTIPDVILQDKAALCRYLEEQAQNNTTRWTAVKLVLVGKENVGKTSILRKLQGKRHDGFSTDGIDISSLTLKDVTFSAFDFGGQAIFYETHQFFLTGRALYLVIFNSTDEDYRNSVEHWLQQIANCRGLLRPPVILVGTHGDQLTTHEAEQLERRLEREYKQRRDNRIEACIVLTTQPSSLKAGTSGVDRLLDLLVDVANARDMLRMQVPSSWIALSQAVIERRQKGVKVIEWQDLLPIAASCGVDDEDKTRDAIKFLHEVGNVLYFDDPCSSLGSLVVVDLNYLASVCCTIVTCKPNFVREGVLLAASLPLVWKSFPPASHSIMLSLLEKFNIMYPLNLRSGTPSEYLVPCLLPTAEPTSECLKLWPETATSVVQHTRQLVFDSLPMGLMGRLVTRVLHMPSIARTVYWRNGVVVASGEQGARAHDEVVRLLFTRVAGSTHELLIQARVRDGASPALFPAVAQTVEGCLSCFFSAMKGSIHTLIACIACPVPSCEGDPPQHMFHRDQLVAALMKGVDYVQCNGGTHVVRIAELAPELSLQHHHLLKHEDVTRDKLLGEGGFGRVYRGTWAGNDVAVKELIIDSGSEDFEAFYKEATIMCGLHSSNLIRLYGITLHPLQMVMELAPLGDLRNLLAATRRPVATVADLVALREEDYTSQLGWELRALITLDIARGLKYLHTLKPNPVMHRDIRSPNCFLVSLDVNAPVRVKLADFGLATWVQPDATGTVGAWQWMAPETNKPGALTYTLASDLYSMGMVMYEIASRKQPFDEMWEVPELRKGAGLNVVKVRKRVLEGLRPTMPESTPRTFAALAQLLWATDPRKRPTVTQTVDTLELIVRSMQSEEEQEDATAPDSTYENRTSKVSAVFFRGLSCAEPEQFRRVCSILSEPQEERIWCGCDNGDIIIFSPAMPLLMSVIKSSQARNPVTGMALAGGLVWCGSARSPLLHCIDIQKRIVVAEVPAHAPHCYSLFLAEIRLTGEHCSLWSGSDRECTLSVCDARGGTLLGKVILDKEHPPVCLAQASSATVCVGSRCSVLLVDPEHLSVRTCLQLRVLERENPATRVTAICVPSFSAAGSASPALLLTSTSRSVLAFAAAGPNVVVVETVNAHVLHCLRATPDLTKTVITCICCGTFSPAAVAEDEGDATQHHTASDELVVFMGDSAGNLTSYAYCDTAPRRVRQRPADGTATAEMDVAAPRTTKSADGEAGTEQPTAAPSTAKSDPVTCAAQSTRPSMGTVVPSTALSTSTSTGLRQGCEHEHECEPTNSMNAAPPTALSTSAEPALRTASTSVELISPALTALSTGLVVAPRTALSTNLGVGIVTISSTAKSLGHSQLYRSTYMGGAGHGTSYTGGVPTAKSTGSLPIVSVGLAPFSGPRVRLPGITDADEETGRPVFRLLASSPVAAVSRCMYLPGLGPPVLGAVLLQNFAQRPAPGQQTPCAPTAAGSPRTDGELHQSVWGFTFSGPRLIVGIDTALHFA
eukprot:TRINITY_DN851_c0_g1_i1.p1 TRINITY_DN851_c0_g1~~TRINITY_DN851_c0_g1_i1.p1  ORF type:complete len:1985 (+),score=446.84 TRINITY_DN851_c0_g1_i1:529-5955(+)